MPAARPKRVVVVPEPGIAPGLRIQLPEGKPFKITLPVATEQEGWIMVPTAGGVGTPGGAFMITLAEAGEVHPAALVTV